MLKKKRILISQPRPDTTHSPYFDIEKNRGVEIIFRPMIKVEPISEKDYRYGNGPTIKGYTAVIFTSKHGVVNFFRLIKELRAEIPDDMKYFCSTGAIAAYLQNFIEYRKRRVFYPETNKFEDLERSFKRHKENYLLVTADVADMKIQNFLTGIGIQFTRSVMYRTVSNDFTPEESFDYDMLVFFSPQGILSLKKNFPDFEQGDIKIAVHGETTQKVAKEAGLTIHIQLPHEKFKSMPDAIDDYLKNNK